MVLSRSSTLFIKSKNVTLGKLLLEQTPDELEDDLDKSRTSLLLVNGPSTLPMVTTDGYVTDFFVTDLPVVPLERVTSF